MSLVAAFALAATVSLAGAAAPADAYHLRNTDVAPDYHSFLRFPPKFPSFRPCVPEEGSGAVTLPRGTYIHGAYMVSMRNRTNPDLENADRPLRVPKRTTYSWKVCRGWNPDPNPEAFDPAAYQVRSTLSLRGRPVHTALMTFQNEVDGQTFLDGERNYEWGGRIVPDPCPGGGCTSPSR